MLSLLHSKIFLKMSGGIIAVVALFALSLLIFTVPTIDRQIYAIESRAARTILDNVLALAEQGENSLTLLRRGAQAAHRQELRTVLDLTESLIRARWARVGRGELTETAARREILDTIRKLQFRRNDYVWISDYDSRLISHPDPDLHGADFSLVRDIRNQLIVPPMVQAALLGGDGYHFYWWRRINEKEPVEKLAYFRHLPELEWVIGTGVYIDDIQKQEREHLAKLIEELRQNLKQIKIAETGYIYIFDSAFNMLIHPNQNIEGSNFAAQQNPTDQQPLGPQLAAAAGREAGWRYLWDRPDDPGNYHYEKISWIHYLPGLDWYIASSVYVDELRSSSVALQKRVILLGLAILLLATLGALLFSRRLTAPLLELSRLAERVRRGDFSGRSPQLRQDEIGQLTATFNQMLDQIQDNINNLDTKVAQRTAELSRALDDLRELDAMKSAFLANISHEMRTPLTSINGFAELTLAKFGKTIKPLLDTETSKVVKTGEQVRQNLEIISQESRRLTALIDNALDLTTLEAGGGVWHMEPVDLQELIAEGATEFAPRLATAGLELKLELAPELPAVRADRRRLAQVLANLLDNAVKFTSQGGITVRAEADDDKITVSVADSGHGIDPDQREAIFEKFRQVGETLTAKPTGAGLGLAICRRIIERHGGVMGVEEGPNGGSIFSFSLPR